VKPIISIVVFLFLDAFLFLFVHWFSFEMIAKCDHIIVDLITTTICSLILIAFFKKKAKEN